MRGFPSTDKKALVSIQSQYSSPPGSIAASRSLASFFQVLVPMRNTNTDLDVKSLVKNLYEDLLLAWNGANASDFARLFSANGNMVGFDGSQSNGSAEISRDLTKIFEDHRTGTFVGIVKEIRQIGETVYGLRAVAGMIPADKQDINPELNCIQTLIASEQEDHFLIEVFQTTPAAFHGRKELSEQLTAELRQKQKKDHPAS